MDGEYPNLRKAGRYLFFFICALGVGVLGAAAMRVIGANREFAYMVANGIVVIAFLTLRDMWKRAS